MNALKFFSCFNSSFNITQINILQFLYLCIKIFFYMEIFFLFLLFLSEIFLILYFVFKRNIKYIRLRKEVISGTCLLTLEKYFYHLGNIFSFFFQLIYKFFSLISKLRYIIFVLIFIYLTFPAKFSSFVKLLETPTLAPYIERISNIFNFVRDNFIFKLARGNFFLNILKLNKKSTKSDVIKISYEGSEICEEIKKLFNDLTLEKAKEKAKEVFFHIYPNMLFVFSRLSISNLRVIANIWLNFSRSLFNYFILKKGSIDFRNLDFSQFTEIEEDFTGEKSFFDIIFRILNIIIFLYFLFKSIFYLFNLVFLGLFSFFSFSIFLFFVPIFENIIFFLKLIFPSMNKVYFSQKQKILFLNKSSNNLFFNFVTKMLFNKSNMPILINESSNNLYEVTSLNKFFNKFNFYKSNTKLLSLIQKCNSYSDLSKSFFSSYIKNSRYKKEVRNFFKDNKSDIMKIFFFLFDLKDKETTFSKNFENDFHYYFTLGILHRILNENYGSPFILNESILFSVIKFLSTKIVFFSEENGSPIAYDNSIGIDLKSSVDFSLSPQERKNLSLLSSAHIPNQFFLQIVPRSGMSNRGLLIINSPGICDPLYQGDLFTNIYNLTSEIQTIHKNDKVAQVIIQNNFNHTLEREIINELANAKNLEENDLNLIFNFSNKWENYFFANNEYKRPIFTFVNQVFINKRKKKGFGSSDKKI